MIKKDGYVVMTFTGFFFSIAFTVILFLCAIGVIYDTKETEVHLGVGYTLSERVQVSPAVYIILFILLAISITVCLIGFIASFKMEKEGY